jgi:hypothetical protein
MNKERIFLGTLNDIRSKIKGTFVNVQQDKINPEKDYDLIRACGLLRHLLIDNPTLLSQMNKDLRLTIEFVTASSAGSFPKDCKYFWYSLTPQKGSGISKKHTLAGFLKLTPLGAGEYRYSVKEIIRMCSHILGGIHNGDATTDEEKAFVKQTENINNGIYMSIYSICQVCLAAFYELEKAVELHTRAVGVSPKS